MKPEEIKTEENLRVAFAVELQARNQYIVFARVAHEAEEDFR